MSYRGLIPRDRVASVPCKFLEWNPLRSQLGTGDGASAISRTMVPSKKRFVRGRGVEGRPGLAPFWGGAVGVPGEIRLIAAPVALPPGGRREREGSFLNGLLLLLRRHCPIFGGHGFVCLACRAPNQREGRAPLDQTIRVGNGSRERRLLPSSLGPEVTSPGSWVDNFVRVIN